MIKINTILYHFVVAIFSLSGAIILSSIYNSSIWWHVNVIMGGIFMSIGLYYYASAKSIDLLILMIKDSSEIKQRKFSPLIKFLFYENVLLVISLLVGIAMLFGIIHRALGENKAVFS